MHVNASKGEKNTRQNMLKLFAIKVLKVLGHAGRYSAMFALAMPKPKSILQILLSCKSSFPFDLI